MKFARPGLPRVKEKLGEKKGQKIPEGWGEKAVLPEKWGPADPLWKK